MSDYTGVQCSFCGLYHSQVQSMVAGQTDAYICSRCIQEASSIVQEELEVYPEDLPEYECPTRRYKLFPIEIREKLDRYVVGQEQAKRVLSVAVYNHYKRIRAREGISVYTGVEIEKSNILLLGPTGTGKTLLARTLARILNVPFSICDATALTEAGYVGEDVESILTQLLAAADYDVSSAERGVIFIDEIDKIARKGDNASVTRDVSGEGVQQALLKVLEGTVARVPPKGGRKHPEQSLTNINTQDILFVCGGAFVGLAEIIARRISANVIGFATGKKKHMDHHDPRILQYVEPDDLVKYGMIPELIGRLSMTASLTPLGDEDMMHILAHTQNALVKQYQKMFALDDIELTFDDAALDVIVKKAQERGTGARGLRSVMESRMLDVMYSAHKFLGTGRCRVTVDTILHGAPPVYEQRRASA